MDLVSQERPYPFYNGFLMLKNKASCLESDSERTTKKGNCIRFLTCLFLHLRPILPFEKAEIVLVEMFV